MVLVRIMHTSINLIVFLFAYLGSLLKAATLVSMKSKNGVIRDPIFCIPFLALITLIRVLWGIKTFSLPVNLPIPHGFDKPNVPFHQRT